MIERLQGSLALPVMGHLGLVLTIVTDFYRRSSDGWVSVAFGVLGLFAFALAGILFVRHPRMFFFGRTTNAQPVGKPGVFLRGCSWALVIGVPVLWLVAVDALRGALPLGLAGRFVGAYVFFAWIAAAIVVSPYLFWRTR